MLSQGTQNRRHEINSEFGPGRHRVTDADATVPIINMVSFSNGNSDKQRNVVDSIKHASEHVGCPMQRLARSCHIFCMSVFSLIASRKAIAEIFLWPQRCRLWL
jgi:hypothetical protein